MMLTKYSLFEDLDPEGSIALRVQVPMESGFWFAT